MPYSKETVIHKAQRAVKLTDSELTIVLSELLYNYQALTSKVEELENEIKKLSVPRSTRGKAAKRDVPTIGVSGEGDS
tara:strand:+ start:921 stop:1154 length:234 start_codon:yes stop_codon:yes gene_type:complete